MRLAVVAVLLVAVHHRVAEACMCKDTDDAVLSRASGDLLPVEPALLLWTTAAHLVEARPRATLDGRAVPVVDEVVLDALAYQVRRLRIGARAPGKLVVHAIVDAPQTYWVVDPLPPAAPAMITGLAWHAPDMECSWAGTWLQVAGPAPAGYRLRWTGGEAYAPASPGVDRHDVQLGRAICGPDWGDPRGDADGHWKDAELARVELDGREVVIARGTFGGGSLPELVPPAAPPRRPPPPPRISAPPAWWPVATGVAGGAALGIGGVWLVGALRRRERSP